MCFGRRGKVVTKSSPTHGHTFFLENPDEIPLEALETLPSNIAEHFDNTRVSPFSSCHYTSLNIIIFMHQD